MIILDWRVPDIGCSTFVEMSVETGLLLFHINHVLIYCSKRIRERLHSGGYTVIELFFVSQEVGASMRDHQFLTARIPARVSRYQTTISSQRPTFDRPISR